MAQLLLEKLELGSDARAVERRRASMQRRRRRADRDRGDELPCADEI